jgi:hypothetical protein
VSRYLTDLQNTAMTHGKIGGRSRDGQRTPQEKWPTKNIGKLHAVS